MELHGCASGKNFFGKPASVHRMKLASSPYTIKNNVTGMMRHAGVFGDAGGRARARRLKHLHYHPAFASCTFLKTWIS